MTTEHMYLEALGNRVIVTPILRDTRIALPEDVVLRNEKCFWQVITTGPESNMVSPGDYVYLDVVNETTMLSFTFEGQVVYCVPETQVAARLEWREV